MAIGTKPFGTITSPIAAIIRATTTMAIEPGICALVLQSLINYETADQFDRDTRVEELDCDIVGQR